MVQRTMDAVRKQITRMFTQGRLRNDLHAFRLHHRERPDSEQ